MAVCLRCFVASCHLLHTHSGKPGFVFFIIARFMMSANSRIGFGLQIVFALLYITPSSLCKLIWRQWTYKMPVRYILSSAWVRLSIFPQLSIIQYLGLCVFSVPISLVMVERIYILWLIIITKSEVWTIIHCLGSGHETMVYAVCLAILFCIEKPRKNERYIHYHKCTTAHFSEDIHKRIVLNRMCLQCRQ